MIERVMKEFETEDIDCGTVNAFTEDTAPDWLTSKNTIKGSTMDSRWFWEDRVLELGVGESISTDFYKITRTA